MTFKIEGIKTSGKTKLICVVYIIMFRIYNKTKNKLYNKIEFQKE